MGRVLQLAPDVDQLPDFVDERGRVVTLCFGRDAFCVAERHFRLRRAGFALFWLRDRGDELCASPLVEDLLRGLTVNVQLPVARGARVGGVEDGVIEEGVGHDMMASRLQRMRECTRRYGAVRMSKSTSTPAYSLAERPRRSASLTFVAARATPIRSHWL